MTKNPYYQIYAKFDSTKVCESFINKKSAVAIISLKRKINLATKANKKNGGKAKLYFTLERKAAC
jgi:hypothetical protein